MYKPIPGAISCSSQRTVTFCLTLILFFFCLCSVCGGVYVCVYMHTQAYTHVYACTWRSEDINVLLYHSLPYPFPMASLTEPELAASNLLNPESRQDSLDSIFYNPGVTQEWSSLAVHMGAGDLSLARTLPTEPSLQPPQPGLFYKKSESHSQALPARSFLWLQE